VHYWEISERTTDEELDAMLTGKERNLEMARQARQWVNRNITLEKASGAVKTLLEGLG
jgi:hypothetical protein